jgi:hypothetical protein
MVVPAISSILFVDLFSNAQNQIDFRHAGDGGIIFLFYRAATRCSRDIFGFLMGDRDRFLLENRIFTETRKMRSLYFY